MTDAPPTTDATDRPADASNRSPDDDRSRRYWHLLAVYLLSTVLGVASLPFVEGAVPTVVTGALVVVTLFVLMVASLGALYCLVPWLWKRRGMYSRALIEWHFWIATIGILLYITSMWVSGIMQGLMWRAYNELGFLEYSFVETVEAMHPYYIIRALGGVLYLAGALLMAWNVYKTIRGDVKKTEDAANPQSAVINPAE